MRMMPTDISRRATSRDGKESIIFITGRASVDILKSGGYKISALDIERELLSLPYIAEAMVVGVPDDEFGQRVAAVITLRNDEIAQKVSIARTAEALTSSISMIFEKTHEAGWQGTNCRPYFAS